MTSKPGCQRAPVSHLMLLLEVVQQGPDVADSFFQKAGGGGWPWRGDLFCISCLSQQTHPKVVALPTRLGPRLILPPEGHQRFQPSSPPRSVRFPTEASVCAVGKGVGAASSDWDQAISPGSWASSRRPSLRPRPALSRLCPALLLSPLRVRHHELHSNKRRPHGPTGAVRPVGLGQLGPRPWGKGRPPREAWARKWAVGRHGRPRSPGAGCTSHRTVRPKSAPRSFLS